MEIKHLKPSELKPYDRNNRKHPKEQIDKLVKQIEAHGFDVPIVVDANHVIIKGHARLAAAKKLKLKTVPVIVRADLTEEQCKAARLADNKLGELAEIDMESIQAEQTATQQNSGGLTDIYLNFGTYVKSFYSVMWSPSCVKCYMMSTNNPRIHHRVSWINATPMIIREIHKK